MKLIEALRKRNRTLLEMHIGILFLGILCQAVGAFFVSDELRYACSLWFGIGLALLGSADIYRGLDRAFKFDEKTAQKLIFRSYLIRYIVLVVIFALIMLTKVMNPLIVFMAYMSLKVTALLWPITHKLCNKLFHETDPVAEPVPQEEQSISE